MHTGFSWTSLECGRHLSDWRTLHLQVFQISHVIVKQDKKRICELDDLTVASKLHQKHTTALLRFTDIVVRRTDTRVAVLPRFQLHDVCPNIMSLNSSTPWNLFIVTRCSFFPQMSAPWDHSHLHFVSVVSPCWWPRVDCYSIKCSKLSQSKGRSLMCRL